MSFILPPCRHKLLSVFVVFGLCSVTTTAQRTKAESWIKEHSTAIRCRPMLRQGIGGRGGGKNELPRCGHSGSPSHSTAVSFSVWHYHGNQVVGVLIWQACLINMCCAARQWGVGESEEGQRRNYDALSAGMKTKQKTKVKSIFWKAGCHLGG